MRWPSLMNPFIQTLDGSWTLGEPTLREHYHNLAGAYTEALVNYCQPADLPALLQKQTSIRVLDVCFGLGYNTWILLSELEKLATRPIVVTIDAIENDPNLLPLMPLILKQPMLNSLKLLENSFEHNVYYQTQSKPPAISVQISPRLHLTLNWHLNDLRQVIPMLEQPYDLVFHDAFSPVKVPQLWTVDLFRHYFRLLTATQGRLLTYSAAGAVRGGLVEAGFQLYRTPALGQKTGGTLAVAYTAPIDASHATPLTAEEQSYIQSRAGIPYRDPSFQNTPIEITAQRGIEQHQSGRLPAKSGYKRP